jgi:hypothetical protein
MTGDKQCSPGSNPHADRPNWKPAETIDEYVKNCREGLEVYSDKHAAKLLGWTRVDVWRAKMMSHIPEELFERLFDHSKTKLTIMAQIGQAFLTGKIYSDAECCPQCGGVLRVRKRVGDEHAKIVNDWIAEQTSKRDAE